MIQINRTGKYRTYQSIILKNVVEYYSLNDSKLVLNLDSLTYLRRVLDTKITYVEHSKIPFFLSKIKKIPESSFYDVLKIMLLSKLVVHENRYRKTPSYFITALGIDNFYKNLSFFTEKISLEIKELEKLMKDREKILKTLKELRWN